MRQEKVPQGIGHGPALAAADVVGRGNWPFYRFERLSNRALAAIGGKCRCGPLGRRDIKIYRKCKVLFPYSTREKSFCAERGSGSGDRSAGDSVRNLFAPQLQLGEREIQKPMVFGGVLFHISFAVERNMAAGGIHAGRGCSPQSENAQRAVGDADPYGGIDESTPVLGGAPMRAIGDAGPYAVRHYRVEHGSGSGDRSGSDSLWAFLRRITFGVKEFQRPWVFGGVFASFCRRGQKDVAPEREIFPPEA